MIQIFETKDAYNIYTNNGTKSDSGTIYYVEEDDSAHFITNNIDGVATIYDKGDIPSGNVEITENGENINIKSYATATVNVPQPSGKTTITQNGTDIDIAQYATADVNVPQPSGNVELTENGTGIDIAQYATATVNVSSGGGDDVLRDLIERDITSITIPSGTTSIGAYVFYSCSNLTSVTIPNSVTSIGSQAFYGCNSLPVENYIRYADTYAVEVTDKNQTSYTVKNGTRFINQDCFNQCNKMTEFTVPDSVVQLGNNCLGYCNALATITIGSGVTNFGTKISDGSKNVRTLIIKSNAMIEKNYQSNYGIGSLFNFNITSVDLQQTTPSSIGNSAFYNCTGLTSINIPSGVTSIGTYAFYNCTGLTSITIPNSVTSIGIQAFRYCSNMTSVTINATTPPTLGSAAFVNEASGRKIYVPAESVETYKAANNWSTYAADIEPIP